MNEKLTSALRATKVVQEHVFRAIESLNNGFEGRIVNSFGIYVQPLDQRIQLEAALEKITAALDLMDQTAWPGSSDYEGQ